MIESYVKPVDLRNNFRKEDTIYHWDFPKIIKKVNRLSVIVSDLDGNYEKRLVLRKGHLENYFKNPKSYI